MVHLLYRLDSVGSLSSHLLVIFHNALKCLFYGTEHVVSTRIACGLRTVVVMECLNDDTRDF